MVEEEEVTRKVKQLEKRRQKEILLGQKNNPN
jgi:hypothetical protein